MQRNFFLEFTLNAVVNCQRMARSRKIKTAIPRGGVPFSVAELERLADAFKAGLLAGTKNARITVSDSVQQGLRALITPDGAISFHVHYTIGESRPYLRIGGLPGTSIAEARELTKTVLALAAKGIDPQDGLHSRLIKELLKKGAAWRP